MGFMVLRLILCLFIFATACHRKDVKPEVQPDEAMKQNELNKISTPIITDTKPRVPKRLRESVHFAASLEREALKLLIRGNSMQKNTLFSVLSYILETSSGSKKSTPLGLDCGKYDLKFEKSAILIAKSCRKPAQDIATVMIVKEDSEYEVMFKTSEWGSVLGISAVLTGSDIKCKLRLVDEKLNVFSCENWIFQLSEDQLSSTVIKADTFLFQRNATQQFVIKGGHYKELVQNRKIDIEVPLKGKIKIIEKEIKVIDEFAAQRDAAVNGVVNEKKEPIEVKAVEETGENSSEKNLEEVRENNGEKSSEKANEENQQQIEGQYQQEGQNQQQQDQQAQPSEQNAGEGTTQNIDQNGQPIQPEEGQTQEPIPPTRTRGRGR